MITPKIDDGDAGKTAVPPEVREGVRKQVDFKPEIS
jgi:hypothetical protein